MLEKESRMIPSKYNYKVFAINYERQKLYERINLRVDKMIEQGLIEEVENIKEKYQKFPTAMQGLGYKEVVEYLQKELSYEEMIEKIKQEKMLINDAKKNNKIKNMIQKIMNYVKIKTK